MRRFFNFTLAAALAAMLMATPAFAQSSAQQGYSEPGGVVQEQIDNPPPNTPPPPRERLPEPPQANEQASTGGDRLPFTGLDLAFVIGAGGMLLAMGVGIRRLSRSTGVA